MMRNLSFGSRGLSISAAAVLAACGGSQQPIGAPGAMPLSQTSAIARHAKRGESMRGAESAKTSFLYVASLFFELSKFRLDGSMPLRTVRLRNSNGFQGLAVNPQGYLFVESGNVSDGTISVYDARTLRAVRELRGPYVSWLVSGPRGYIYAANCGDAIYVIAPDGTGVVGFVTDHVVGACKLAFGPSGDLFVENQNSVAIYTPVSGSEQWAVHARAEEGDTASQRTSFRPPWQSLRGGCTLLQVWQRRRFFIRKLFAVSRDNVRHCGAGGAGYGLYAPALRCE